MNAQETIGTSEIARIAGVNIATVSNWRKRNSDFPLPLPGDGHPRYDRAAVTQWLTTRGVGAEPSNLRLFDLMRSSPNSLLDTVRISLELVSSTKSLAPSDRTESNIVTNYRENHSVGAADERLLEAVASEISGRSDQELAGFVQRLVKESQRSTRGVGEFYTPEPIASYLAALSKAAFGRSELVIDPAAGIGGFLRAALEEGAATAGRGVEINADTAEIANLIANASDANYTVVVGDAFNVDLNHDAGLVLCAPPLGLRVTGDIARVLPFGLPTKDASIALVWQQLAVSSLNSGGRGFVLDTTTSVTSTRGREVRSAMLRARVVRGIVALPPRLLDSTGIALIVWVLGSPDPDLQSVTMADFSRMAPADFWSDEKKAEALAKALADSTFEPDSTSLVVQVPLTDLLTPDVNLRPAPWVYREVNEAALDDSVDHASRAIANLGRSLDVPALKIVAKEQELMPLISIRALADSGEVKLFQGRYEKPDASGGSRRVLTSRFIDDFELRSEAPRVSDSEIRVVSIQPGDVVVGSGPSGLKATVWNEDGWVAGSFTWVIRVQSDRINAGYLASALLHPRNFAHIDSTAHRPSIDIQEFTIAIPNRQTQELLVAAVNSVNSRLEVLANELHAISAERDKLAMSVATGNVVLAPKGER